MGLIRCQLVDDKNCKLVMLLNIFRKISWKLIIFSFSFNSGRLKKFAKTIFLSF